MLVEQLRICTVGLPRDPDDEVVAEPPHLVGPTAGTKFERSVSQIGMLIPQQISDELGSQLDLCLLAEPIEEGHAPERYRRRMPACRRPGKLSRARQMAGKGVDNLDPTAYRSHASASDLVGEGRHPGSIEYVEEQRQRPRGSPVGRRLSSEFSDDHPRFEVKQVEEEGVGV